MRGVFEHMECASVASQRRQAVDWGQMECSTRGLLAGLHQAAAAPYYTQLGIHQLQGMLVLALPNPLYIIRNVAFDLKQAYSVAFKYSKLKSPFAYSIMHVCVTLC